jgi:mannonate dehydratase
MKLGLGFYFEMLTPENYRFAHQMGVTHLVVHLSDYRRCNQPRQRGLGLVKPPLWSYERLRDLRAAINAEGLELEALENFDPSFWYDILLDGPRKKEQIEDLKQIIRNMGRAGIPIMGYNFSLAGVWGHAPGPWARGDAQSVGYIEGVSEKQTPIPNGMVWNMWYDHDAPEGFVGQIPKDEFWQRAKWFLEEMIPIAEESGVKLAAHPDDPPLDTLRGTPRLVNKPEHYQKLFDLVPSDANMAEFCQGTIQEMNSDVGMDVYDAIDRYAGMKKIAYVHFRNVVGHVPSYREVFIDEGDVDMARALRLYVKHGFDGLIMPDHTPNVECAAPWHAGMAYALGYLKALLSQIEK